MTGAVLERMGRGDADDPFNWVTRAKLQTLMNEQYHRCKAVIEQHLDAYYGERQGSVFARAGVTARASVELFEDQAVKLVGLLADSARPLSRHPRAFQMIAELTQGFLTYVDLVVGRIGPRIDLEMRNLSRSENMPRGACELWAESRERVVESLDRQRAEFGLPEEQAPAAEGPPLPEMEFELPVYDLETAIESEAEVEEALASDTGFESGFDTEAEADTPFLLEEEAGPPAPEAQHWQEMWTDIAVQLCTGKLRPEAQGDLGGAMAQWFAERGIAGAQAEVDACARRFWRKFVATRRVTSSLDQSAIELAMEECEFVLDSLAWRSGSICRAGFRNGDSVVFREDESARPSSALPAREFGYSFPGGPEGAPAFPAMRYQVSWSDRQDSRLTAPGFEML